MKKMMDPVLEAEKIIAEYLGAKAYACGRDKKSARRRSGGILFLAALFSAGAAAALYFITL